MLNPKNLRSSASKMGFAVLSSYGSVGGACSVIDRQIKVDKKLRRRIEQIREMASSASIQKKT
jgi:hypothetical protein